MTNILMSGSALFIWHLKDNLSLGGGISVNSSFGYPMVFPSFYLQWQLRGKYEVNIQLVDAVELSAGVNFSNKFKLKLIGSMSGSLALEKIEGKKMMFMHQYMIVGLQPELTLGKFSIPITLGANVVRMARYKDRKLKAMFNNKDEKSNFDVAPYGSIALRYNF